MSYGTPPPQQPGQPQSGWGQQPPQQPGWGAGGPPQPRKNNVGKIVGFGCGGLVLLLVIIAVIGAFLTSGSDTDDEPGSVLEVTASASASGKGKSAPAPKGAEADVQITACEVNASTTWPSANLEIVNHSSSKANYIISIEFVDAAGTRLGEGMAATNNLAPGQKALEKAQALSDTKGKVTCRVAKVSRYSAP